MAAEDILDLSEASVATCGMAAAVQAQAMLDDPSHNAGVAVLLAELTVTLGVLAEDEGATVQDWSAAMLAFATACRQEQLNAGLTSIVSAISTSFATVPAWGALDHWVVADAGNVVEGEVHPDFTITAVDASGVTVEDIGGTMNLRSGGAYSSYVYTGNVVVPGDPVPVVNGVATISGMYDENNAGFPNNAHPSWQHNGAGSFVQGANYVISAPA